MISYKSTSNFRERLQSLVTYKRDVYSGALVEERVALLDIYPKRGPLQQLDIPDDELLRLLAQYVDEGNRDALMDFEL